MSATSGDRLRDAITLVTLAADSDHASLVAEARRGIWLAAGLPPDLLPVSTASTDGGSSDDGQWETLARDHAAELAAVALAVVVESAHRIAATATLAAVLAKPDRPTLWDIALHAALWDGDE